MEPAAEIEFGFTPTYTQAWSAAHRNGVGETVKRCFPPLVLRCSSGSMRGRFWILRLVWRGLAAARLAVSAMAVMTFIELFQLTMIPARLLTNEHLVVRTCARLIGTEFSFRDLLAYSVGIACIYLVDFSNA